MRDPSEIRERNTSDWFSDVIVNSQGKAVRAEVYIQDGSCNVFKCVELPSLEDQA